MNLLVIDLDGTITKSDNLVEFSLFMVFKKKQTGFLLIFPLLFLLKLKLINNINFKIWFSLLIFKKMDVSFLNNCAKEYVSSNSFQRNINPFVLDFINKQSDTKKIIISANYDFLVQAISVSLSIEQSESIILDQNSGKYTGKITGIIPFGKRKVDVYLQITKTKTYNKTIGLGDSKSDLFLLQSLDEGYLIQYNSKDNSTIFKLVSK